MARQPIFDRNDRVAGYELLYRDSSSRDSAGGDAKTRSARSIEALLELGIEKLVGSSLAFLNVDFDFIDCPLFDALPSERLVLEILEDTLPTRENIDRVKNLALRGYILALDDYAFQPHLEPFLEHCRIIKLECPILDIGRDHDRIRRLVSSGKAVLAEKVEDFDVFKAYKDLGCHLFQGFYFAKPSLIEGQSVASNKAALITLLAKFHDEDVSLRDVERIVSADVTFTYKLMKLVQSALVAAPPQVQTVGQAIQFLGLRSTASIASILALSAIPGRPSQLMVLALSRAKMCEELARANYATDADAFFTLGLLSSLEAFLNRPMAEILEELPLTENMAEALLQPDSDSEMATTLQCALAYERGQFDKVDHLGFDSDSAQKAYSAGLEWADQTFGALKAA